MTAKSSKRAQEARTAAGPPASAQSSPRLQTPRQTPVKRTAATPAAAGPHRPRTPDRPNAVAGAAGGRPLGKNTSKVSRKPSGTNRRSLWQLRDALRPIQAPRLQKCGHCRFMDAVQVAINIEGRAAYRGIMRCGSVWSCPVCRATIQRERAADLIAAVAWHRKTTSGVYMLTLTVRHAMGDDLARIRRGVANAWKKVQQGKSWIRWKSRVGFVGSVRALEVTHGRNGFHPHLHILLLARNAQPRTLERWRQELSVRWQHAVERTLGAEHRPNDRRGTDLRRTKKDDYLAKLGLEIVGTAAKRGRQGSRSALEVAADYTHAPNERDAGIWRSYADGMRGARMLTWSKGLRAAAGLGVERTDEEIVNDTEAGTVAWTIAPASWKVIIGVKNGPLRLLEALENDGVMDLRAWAEHTFGLEAGGISYPHAIGPPDG